MIRYYHFADITIAISGLPEIVQDGQYLSCFCSPREDEVLRVDVEQCKLVIPADAVDMLDHCRYMQNGKEYRMGWIQRIKPAVAAAPADWKQQALTIQVNPELYEKPYFTVNQILALAGFHSAFLYRNCATLHCSYVDIGGRAILFAGASGAGKSTQAQLWHNYRGADIINGDRALIFRRNGVWFAGGISICGSSDICQNKTLPVAAIVLVSKASINQMVTVPFAECFRAILAGMAFYQWSQEETELASNLAMDIVSGIPIYRLCCRPDEGAVEALEKGLRYIYDV